MHRRPLFPDAARSCRDFQLQVQTFETCTPGQSPSATPKLHSRVSCSGMVVQPPEARAWHAAPFAIASSAIPAFCLFRVIFHPVKGRPLTGSLKPHRPLCKQPLCAIPWLNSSVWLRKSGRLQVRFSANARNTPRA